MALRDSGRDLRGGRRRFESHGWRLGRGPWRREGRSGKSSGGVLVCYYCTVACPYHTLIFCCFGIYAMRDFELRDDEVEEGGLIDRFRLIRLSALHHR